MEFFGLLGEKLSHSLSPKIHKEILKNISKDGAYGLFQIEKNKLKDFTEAVKLLQVKGFNVTIPYKQDVMPYLDFISEEAKAIGAVNTVLVKDNMLYGYNTDYYGFGQTLTRANIDLKDKVAVILGAGGACKAALAYLLDNKISKVYIVSRNPSNVIVHDSNNRIEIINYDRLNEIEGYIIINSTPVGMYPNVGNSPVGSEIIKKFNVAMDLIYNPTDTEFIKIAKKENLIALGGLYMLVGQAVKAQEIFQDIQIKEDIINNIYYTISKEFN